MCARVLTFHGGNVPLVVPTRRSKYLLSNSRKSEGEGGGSEAGDSAVCKNCGILSLSDSSESNTSPTDTSCRLGWIVSCGRRQRK